MPSWTDCLEAQDWHDGVYREVLETFKHADWQASIGCDLEHFPIELRLMVYQCFALEHPLCIYWGRNLVQIYNSSFHNAFIKERQVIGMGQPWLEVWGKEYASAEAVHALFMHVYDSGKPSVANRSQSFLPVTGELREMFFNNTISPVRDVNGAIKGISCLLTDATDAVLAERRQIVLQGILSAKSTVNTEADVAAVLNNACMREPSDLPCLVAFHCNQALRGDHERTYSMIACAGANPEHLDISVGTAEAASWHEKPTEERVFRDYLLEAIHKREPVCLTNARVIQTFCQNRAFGDLTRTVWFSPIFCYGEQYPAGVAIQGLNPRRPQSDISFVNEINQEIRACLEIVDQRASLQNELNNRKAELVDSQKRFEVMAKACPAGIFILNLSSGKFEFVNDAYYEVTGIPKTAGIENWLDYIHEDSLEDAKEVWENFQHRPIVGYEARWKSSWRGDLERWTTSSAIIHEDDNGTKYAFGAFINSSPMRYALKVEKERADAAIATKHQQLDFLDMIAHELRNPLGAIMQTSDFLVEKVDANRARTFSEDDTEDLRTIVLCAQHMSRIINDTLNLSKLEGGMLIATHVPTQPLAVVQSIIAMFEAEAKRNQTSLQLQIDPSFHLLNVDWVLTDPSRLTQIIINFLANSIKFVGKMKTRNVTITLAAATRPMETRVSVDRRPSLTTPVASTYSLITPEDEERPLYLVCRVTDTGPGMSPEQVASLFQRYFQASPRTHVEYGGSGLGLFISKQLVTLLNGTIDVESVANEGTTFSFSIKTVPCEAPKKEIVPAEVKQYGPTPPPTEAFRDIILIAEDNLINQKIMVKQLSNAGYLSIVANNGREVIEELIKDDKGPRRIAICLCDIEMPVLGGIDTIKEVRRMEKSGELSDRCPFIAVTANARQEQVAAMIDAGMDDQVPKPLRFKFLLTKIADLLTRLNRRPLSPRRQSFLGTEADHDEAMVVDGKEEMRTIPESLTSFTRHRSFSQLWRTTTDAMTQIRPFDVILLNTQSPQRIAAHIWQRAGLNKQSLRVCTDGATDRLHREVFHCALESLPASEHPDVVIGDLDSIALSTKSFYEARPDTQVVRVEDQNSTDFTKAVHYITSLHQDSDIIVLGGIGGRLDQTFSTINTLFTRPGIYIVDTDNIVCLLSAGKHEIDCSGLGRHCGLVPMGGSVKCWSKGLEWCLNGETMSVGGLISTNNRVTDSARIVSVECDGPVLFSVELNL